jgi:hypothetical protein
MKILLLGDSFGADWTIKYPNKEGWPNLLSKEYFVDNQCQAGCSEFRIQTQLVKHTLDDITHCIVVHTSPYRLPVEHNPLHQDDCLHHSCDFIYSDVAESNNPQVACVKEYYEKYFFDEFFLYAHQLIVSDISCILKEKNIPSLHITFFNNNNNQIDINYHKLFVESPGLMNHLSSEANQHVFDDIKKWINKN